MSEPATRKRAAAKPESSEALRAQIEQTRAEIAASEQRIADLAGSLKADVIAGDAVAIANEDEQRNLRFKVIRLNAQLAALIEAEATARAAEAEESATRKRDHALQAVAAVVADAEAHYVDPARKIAAFMKRWNEAEHLAREAGVTGPESTLRPGEVVAPYEPARYRDVEYTTFLDDNGNETRDEFGLDDMGRRGKTEKYRREKVTRTRREKVADSMVGVAYHLPALAESISIPRLRYNDAAGVNEPPAHRVELRG